MMSSRKHFEHFLKTDPEAALKKDSPSKSKFFGLHSLFGMLDELKNIKERGLAYVS